MRSRLVLVSALILAMGPFKHSNAACKGVFCDPDDKTDNYINPPEVPPPDGVALPTRDKNSCEYAFNDVCDEPSKCKVGTDSRDCGLVVKP